MTMRRLRYFKPAEFDCRCCATGSQYMDMRLVNKLDSMRHEVGRPFVINSGYRCESHNNNVGGELDSAHLKGLAVDVQVPDSKFRHDIIELAMFYGINRIGIYKTFVHLDIDPDKPSKVIWYSSSRLG